MITVYLFGATSPSGQTFSRLLSSYSSYRVHQYSRSSSNSRASLDLRSSSLAELYSPEPTQSFIISFAPIWHLASFLQRSSPSDVSALNLAGIIACSSSSVVSKQYSWSLYDQQLVSKLRDSETVLSSFCSLYQLSLRIIRPSLIYGSCDDSQDTNFSALIRLLRWTPVLPIPATSGLRQPIHVTQLSSGVMTILEDIAHNCANPTQQKILLGGDLTTSYKNMLQSIQRSLPPADLGRYCLILSIPNRLFFFMASSIMLISPKFYAALLRISSNLSGYQTISDLTSDVPKRKLLI